MPNNNKVILVDGGIKEHPVHAEKKAKINKHKGKKFKGMSRADKDDLLFVLALNAGLIDENGEITEVF